MSTNQTKEKGSIVSKKHPSRIPDKITQITETNIKILKHSPLQKNFLSIFIPKNPKKVKIVKNKRFKDEKCQQITQKKTGDLWQNNTHAEFQIEKPQSLKQKQKFKTIHHYQSNFVLFTQKISQEGKNWKDFTLEGRKLQRIHP